MYKHNYNTIAVISLCYLDILLCLDSASSSLIICHDWEHFLPPCYATTHSTCSATRSRFATHSGSRYRFISRSATHSRFTSRSATRSRFVAYSDTRSRFTTYSDTRSRFTSRSATRFRFASFPHKEAFPNGSALAIAVNLGILQRIDKGKSIVEIARHYG